MADIREDGSEIFHYEIPDFPLSIKKNYIPANIEFPELSIHWHEEIEITYVISRSVDHQLNGKRVKLNAGEAIFINSKQLHLIQSDKVDCELYCLIFNPTLLCASNYIAGKYVVPIIENENLDYFYLKDDNEEHKPVLDAIIKIHELKGDDKFELKSLEILLGLWRSLFAILPKIKANEVVVNEDLNKVKKMLSLVHRNYAENIGLEQICAAGNVGKTKGTDLFYRFVNMTPVEYLINYRIEVASNMLLDTTDSVTDIAMAVGFSESSYFARTFKSKMGMSPLKYRKTMKDIVDKA